MPEKPMHPPFRPPNEVDRAGRHCVWIVTDEARKGLLGITASGVATPVWTSAYKQYGTLLGSRGRTAERPRRVHDGRSGSSSLKFTSNDVQGAYRQNTIYVNSVIGAPLRIGACIQRLLLTISHLHASSLSRELRIPYIYLSLYHIPL